MGERSGWYQRVAAWFDLSTAAGQRRTAIASGATLALGLAWLLRPFAPILCFFLAVLALWEWLSGARERARDRAFARALEGGGGDLTALRGALATLHRAPGVVKGPRGADIPIAGFDSRLGDGDDAA
ncbi:MAG: hypothetical protein ACKO5K_12330 [Armatimonadota bacterium]